MSEPRVIVEVQGQCGESPAQFVVPVDSLRKTFFDDLDASSKVNPNRARKLRMTAEFDVSQAYGVVRDVVVGELSEERNPVVHAWSPDSPSITPSRQSETAYDNSSMVNRRISLPVAESASRCGDEQQSTGVRGEPLDARRRKVQACGAMMANAVMGAAVGMTCRRITSSILAQVGISVVVLQSLSFMGYASIQWRALIADLYAAMFRGVPFTEEEMSVAANHSLSLWIKRVQHRLTKTIPRRLSFWVGVGCGAMLL